MELNTVLASLAATNPQGLTMAAMLEAAGLDGSAADKRAVLRAAAKAGLERTRTKNYGMVFKPMKERRPGLLQLAERIQKENPDLGDEACIARAKAQWTAAAA